MDAIKTRAAAREYPIMTATEIEGLIADGRMVIIVDQHVLKVDTWMKYHPGGERAIEHMVGRDATDEVTACVPTSSSLPSCFPCYPSYSSFTVHRPFSLTPHKPALCRIASLDE